MSEQRGKRNTGRLSPRDLIDYACRQARAADAGPPPTDGEASPRETLPGAIQALYRLRRRVSAGGQGVVYEAIQASTGQRVALKIIRPAPGFGELDRMRFEREIGILARLNHPGIVKILDCGSADGWFYCAMTFIDGLPLDQFVAVQRPPRKRLLALFAEVCEAVTAAHRLGVIHRDLKPRNILVDRAGRPHVLDFGLAKGGVQEDGSPVSPTITEEGQFLGSLPWSSPEQIEAGARHVDTRSDIYSLGVILFHVLTGAFPYPMEISRRELMNRVVEDDPIRPGALVPDIDDDLETIVLKCLAKDPDRRYQTADDLARDIRHYLAGEPIQAKRDSRWYVLRKTLRRHWVPALAAGVVLTVILASSVVSTVFWLKAREEAVLARRAEQVARRRSRELAETMYASNMNALAEALRNRHTNRMLALLEACPPELRGWEWLRYRFLADRSVAVLHEPGFFARKLVFSPDDRWLAAGGSKDRADVLVWDWRSGRLHRCLKGHTEIINDLAFDPGGSHLVSVSNDGQVLYWSLPDGAPSARRTLKDSDPSCAAFAPDGRSVFIGDDAGRVLQWVPIKDEMLFSRQVHKRSLIKIALSSDARLLTQGAEHTLSAWSWPSMRLGFQVEPPESGLSTFAISSNGEKLAVAARDGTIALYDGKNGRRLGTLPGASKASSLAFSPDGRMLASGHEDHLLRLWDVPSGRLIDVLHGHRQSLNHVALSSDGRWLASDDNEGMVRLWDLVARETTLYLPGHPWQVTGLAALPDSRLLSCGEEGAIKLWDLDTGRELHTIYGHTCKLQWIASEPLGRWFIAAYSDATLLRWDLAAGKVAWARKIPNPLSATSFNALAIGPKGDFVVCGVSDDDPNVWIVNASDGEIVKTLTPSEAITLCMTLSPDGRHLATGQHDGSLTLVDIATGKILARRHPYTSGTAEMGFSPDGHLLASALNYRSQVDLWDAETLEPVRRLDGHPGMVLAIAFSPDGKRLATLGTQELIIWNIPDGEALFRSSHRAGTPTHMIFSPDGRRIIAGWDDGSIRVWETQRVSLEKARQRQVARLAAEQVKTLYARYITSEKVRTALAADPTLPEDVRQEALRLVDVNGDNPWLLNLWAWGIVSHAMPMAPKGFEHDMEAALEMAELAARLAPQHPGILNTLAMARLRLAQQKNGPRRRELLEAALSTFEAADRGEIARKGHLTTLNQAGIALCLHYLGRDDEAREALERARKLCVYWTSDSGARSALLGEATSALQNERPPECVGPRDPQTRPAGAEKP